MNPGHLPIVVRAVLFGLACVACLLPSHTSADSVPVVQYAHRDTGHVFMTAFDNEIDVLDASAEAGHGQWFRNWRKFRAFDAPEGTLAPVCRFLSANGSAPTHFFTAFADECAAVKRSPAWVYEGIAFHAELPDAAGRCATGSRAVYRAFRVAVSGSAYHSYTLSTAEAEGGDEEAMPPILEGVAWCVPLEGAADSRDDYLKSP